MLLTVGACPQAHLSKTFVGLILLPIIGNAVEHITAVTVAMKVWYVTRNPSFGFSHVDFILSSIFASI